MVFGSVSGTETPPVNPPAASSSPPPPIMTAASFYLQPHATTPNYIFPFPSGFRWNTSLPYHNFLPSYSTMNPVQRWVSTPNRTENLSNPVLRFGSSPSLPVLRFGSTSNRDENKTSPVLRLGSSPNRTEDLSSSFLRLGSSPNREENKSSTVLRLGSFSNRDEIRGNSSGSNRIENNGNGNNNEWGGLALGPGEPVSEDGVDEPVEPVEKKGKELDGKGKSKLRVCLPVNGKGSGENSGEGDVDRNGDGDGGREGDEEEVEEAEPEMEFSEEDEAEEPNFPFVKTWNLRPRKPVTKPPNPGNNGGGRGGSRNGVAKASKSRPVRTRARPRGEKPATTALGAAPMVQKRPVFSVPLTKEEIEDDIHKMTGEKPSKKPNKRPKIVQRQLDACFPGLWLGAVTTELYRVPDPPLKG